MKQYAFGIDIGGTTIKMGFFHTNGELKDVWEIPTRLEQEGNLILDDIQNAIQEKLEKESLSIEDIEGVGMGIPGPIGSDGTVFGCINLGWKTFNVCQTMEKKLGCKVRAGNDANVAALGEMWQGGGKGKKSIVMVTLGTGVGGGVIIDGKIVAGANGAGGEIGHIPTKQGETQPCACGNYGCLEQYASANGWVKLTKKYLEEHKDIPSSLHQLENFTTKDICKAAQEKDVIATEMVEQLGQMLGKALATIGVVVNPEAFIIGGGLSNAGALILDPIQKYYKQYAFHSMENTEIKKAILSNNAGIYGAVKLILD
ncbi:ROK family glucokinase [Floccifex sp.]|uniref:ROK family glucokinase n=1 Tax=Floccifex sp. TaxID=2815810 RepID=UPI003EFD1C50